MELKQEVNALQDEVKLLKGEIKNILKEIRTAVLSRDNPFAVNASPPTFNAVGRSTAGSSNDPGGEPGAGQAAPAPPTAPESTLGSGGPTAPPPGAGPAGPTSPPTTAPGGPTGPPPGAGPVGLTPPPTTAPGGPTGPPPGAGPVGLTPLPTTAPGGPTGPPPTAGPVGPTQREPTPLRPAEQEAPTETPAPPDGGPDPPSQREPTPLRPAEQETPAETPAPRWNLLTIASLTAWAEEALVTLGPKRFEIVLELGSLAELVPAELRDVLRGIVQLLPAQETEDRRMNINECLVVLRQLEAILQGEKVSKLPRRRSARRTRVR